MKACLTPLLCSLVAAAHAAESGPTHQPSPTPSPTTATFAPSKVGWVNETLRAQDPAWKRWNLGAFYWSRYEIKENGGFTGSGSAADFRKDVDNDNSYLLQRLILRAGYTGDNFEVFAQARHSSATGDDRSSSGNGLLRVDTNGVVIRQGRPVPTFEQLRDSLLRPVALDAGRIMIRGRETVIDSPQRAIRQGLGLLTEDRKRLGLFLDMSCGENINIGVIDRDARSGGVLDLGSAKRRAEAAFKALRVRAASPAVLVGSLSGGNQQKVLLSRWLEIGPKVLILDEPTRGVDIGAKSEIYRIIDELAKREIGVVVISSELPEVIGICDRVLVMREGQIEGEVGGPSGKAITQENIMALAAGVAA